MEILSTPIADLQIIKPTVYEDNRGYFMETYNAARLKEHNLTNRFVQDNESLSHFGVIRGLHYQLSPYAQAKLVRVVKGTILDVALDIRKNSPTFGQHFSIELSDRNKLQLLIPKGFAHGFSVLSNWAIVSYKCDSPYNPKADRGIRYNDPTLGIDWKIPESEVIVSAKDGIHPPLEQAEINFIFGAHE